MPLAPIYGGVAASHNLFSSSTPPAQHVTAAMTYDDPPLSPSPAYRAPSSPAHSAPASPARRVPASPARRVAHAPAFPAFYTAPHTQTVQHNDQAASHSQFFILLVGYSPGVYTSM